jgi:hypothetical protein
MVLILYHKCLDKVCNVTVYREVIEMITRHAIATTLFDGGGHCGTAQPKKERSPPSSYRIDDHVGRKR